MAVKINDFVIQAKVNEECEQGQTPGEMLIKLPPSVKEEIIDECLEKIKELLRREKTRY